MPAAGRRSAEAPKRRSAGAPKRRSAEAPRAAGGVDAGALTRSGGLAKVGPARVGPPYLSAFESEPMQRVRALWPLLVVVLIAPGVGAQGGGAPGAPGDVQAARALFEEARRDEQAGRWGEALGKLQRILQSKETASVRFHAAYCEEKLGELASAYRDYERALELARSTQGPDRKLIVEQSADGLKDLTGRVPELVLQLPRDVEGVRVTFDGTEVPAARASGPLRVNPGLHVLNVSAPGKKPFSREFSLSEREKHTVVVLFEPASGAPPAAAPPPAAPAPGTTAAPAAPAVPAERPAGAGGGSSIAPWVVGGASVALAGVGVGFFFAGRSQGDKLDECRGGGVVCKLSDIEATRTRNYAIAGSAGALALVGGGVTLALALARGNDAPAAKAASGPLVGPGWLGWAGRF